MAWTRAQDDISRNCFQQWKAKNKAGLERRDTRRIFTRVTKRDKEKDSRLSTKAIHPSNKNNA